MVLEICSYYPMWCSVERSMMNERIQELMKQSMVEYQFQHRFSPEKFAELIVRECADLATRNQAEDMGWDIGEIIKEHFGVEE
jgi:hypothetical protein